MKTPTIVKFCKSLSIASLFLCGTFLATAATEAPRRIHGNIDDSKTAEIKGHVRPAVVNAQDLGPVDGSKVLAQMSVHFALSAAQQTDLNQLLQQLQDPNSKNFHKFLTPEEYGARFGLNSADLEKVTLWLEQKGFTNVQAARSRTFVTFSGTAAQAASAFNTSLHSYLVNGETHFANSTNPHIPRALSGIVANIRGLHDFHPKAHVRLRPHYTSSSSGNHYLAPDDWATIYDVQALYNAGYTGAGVSIAVVGQSDVYGADILAFRAAAGLSSSVPSVVYATTDPGIQSGDESESDLDLEWAGAIAKNASIIFVVGNPVTANGVDDAVTYAIDQNVAPVISTSYGLCEQLLSAADFQTEEAQFQQANTQGITILAAAGDGGAADCDTGYPAKDGLAVDYPAASQYVTGVGGTTLSDSSGNWNSSNNSYGGSVTGYIPEFTWNETNSTNGLTAGGGGASVLTNKPSWQTGTGVPADGKRDVPDIAFTAGSVNSLIAAYQISQAALVCSTSPNTAQDCTTGFRNAAGYLDTIEGTSAGAPPMAGLVALLIQKTGGRQGNINPRLYTLAATAPSAFHDITSGNNIVPCQSGTTGCPGSLQYGYSAGPGYDQNTGLGSLDANNLFAAWPDYGLTLNPTSLNITRGNSGTTTLHVAPVNGFSGSVSLTCSVPSSLTNVTCSIPGSPDSSGNAVLTVTAGTLAAAPWRFVPPSGGSGRLWLLMAAAGLLALALAFRKQQGRGRLLVATAACSVLLIGLVACGGGGSSGGGGGSSNVTVPNVVGLTQTAATNSLTAAGLVAGTITTQSSTTVANGSVISQSPAAAASVANGSAVNLVVSSGPPVGTGTVTVTATSGQFTKTTSVAVTVQ